MVLTGRQVLLIIIALVLIVGSGVAIQQVATVVFDLEAQDAREWVEGFGALGPLVYMASLMTSIVFSPLPTAVLAVAAGLAYGVVLGTLYTIVGGMAGGAICFFLARRFGRPWLARHLKPATMEYIDRLALALGARLVFLTRVVPIFGFEWVSYAAGLTPMRFSTFFTWSLIGSLPPVIAISYVGAALDDDPLMSLLVLGGLILIALGTLLYFYFRRTTIGVLASRVRDKQSHAATSADTR